MGNDRIHLITITDGSQQFAVLALDGTLGIYQLNLVHHTHQQFFFIKRLGKEIAGTNLEALHQVSRAIQRREENNWNIFQFRVFFQDNCRIKATNIGHHDVKQYQVRLLSLCLFDTHITTIGCAHLELLVCQQYLEQQHVTHDIIDDKNLIITFIYL